MYAFPFHQVMLEKMKEENEKLAAAGGASGGDSKLEEMLAAKQAELQVMIFPKFLRAVEILNLPCSFFPKQSVFVHHLFGFGYFSLHSWYPCCVNYRA